MIRWSRQQGYDDEKQYFADVPGGALVKFVTPMGPPVIVFVPNVHVYDAGGMSGPFLKTNGESS